jgi:hypothetical protein
VPSCPVKLYFFLWHSSGTTIDFISKKSRQTQVNCGINQKLERRVN